MEIRAKGKDYERILRHYNKSAIINKNMVSLTKDDSVQGPVIMTKTVDGELRFWTEGMDHVLSFLKYGYVRIIKKCPYQLGKCRGEKCQLFQVRNATGDCAHNWTAIGVWDRGTE